VGGPVGGPRSLVNAPPQHTFIRHRHFLEAV
jgi:hypothetical protein